MWGTYIEGRISEAQRNTKDPKQAEMRVTMTLKSILQEREDDEPGEDEMEYPKLSPVPAPG